MILNAIGFLGTHVEATALETRGTLMKPPIPSNEKTRLAKLHDYAVLDTEAEQSYDDITELAAFICGTPVALVSLVDENRQWFKSHFGLDATETHRDMAFCAHAICSPGEVLIVSDATRDARFADNPLVVDNPNIRFYAGAPLVTPTGEAIGTLCAIDYAAGNLYDSQRQALKALARQVVHQLEMGKALETLRDLTVREAKAQEQVQLYEREIKQLQAQLASRP